jgi:hypothetical protein
MKTPRHNRKGFILFIAVAMLPLIGIAMLLMSSSTRMLLGELNLARRQAHERTILASATAWVKQNQDNLVKQPQGYSKELDTSAFDLKNSKCTVTIESITDGIAHVTIQASARPDGHLWRHSIDLTIPPEPEPEPDLEVSDPNNIEPDITEPPLDPNSTDNDLPQEVVIPDQIIQP